MYEGGGKLCANVFTPAPPPTSRRSRRRLPDGLNGSALCRAGTDHCPSARPTTRSSKPILSPRAWRREDDPDQLLLSAHHYSADRCLISRSARLARRPPSQFINGVANVPFPRNWAISTAKDILVVAFSVAKRSPPVSNLSRWFTIRPNHPVGEPNQRVPFHQDLANLHQESEAGDQRSDGITDRSPGFEAVKKAAPEFDSDASHRRDDRRVSGAEPHGL